MDVALVVELVVVVDMGVVDMEVVAALDVAVDVAVDVEVDPDTVVISFLLDDILKSKNFSIKT